LMPAVKELPSTSLKKEKIGKKKGGRKGGEGGVRHS